MAELSDGERDVLAASGEMPSAGRLRLGGGLLALTGVGCIAMVAFAFRRRTALRRHAMMATLGVTVLAALVLPSHGAGAGSTKPIAYLMLGIVALQCLSVLGAVRLRDKELSAAPAS